MFASSVEVSINGEEFSIPAWSVAQGDNVVAKFNEIAKLMPVEQAEGMEALIAEEMGWPLQQLKELDAAAFDQLVQKIVETNKAPLRRSGD